jgi:two-component system response regulator FixJ
MFDATVFLVDADPAVRDSLTTLMDLNGIRVESFATGAAFFRSLKIKASSAEGAASPPRCVICEAELPDTTGIELYETLQAEEFPGAFALLVSQRDATMLRSAERVGITRIFSKPLVHRHLLSFVSNA